MEGFVLSFFKTEWKVGDRGSAQWASSLQFYKRLSTYNERDTRQTGNPQRLTVKLSVLWPDNPHQEGLLFITPRRAEQLNGFELWNSSPVTWKFVLFFCFVYRYLSLCPFFFCPSVFRFTAFDYPFGTNLKSNGRL